MRGLPQVSKTLGKVFEKRQTHPEKWPKRNHKLVGDADEK